MNFDLLHEELRELPGAITERKDPDTDETRYFSNYTINKNKEGFVVKARKGLIDQELIDSVVANHDPTKESKNQKAKKEKAKRKRDILKRLKITEEEFADLL